jgi:cytoskeletal protein CcmA (bactofilin family)
MALFGKDAPPPPRPLPSRPQPSRPDDPQSKFEGTFFGPNIVVDGNVTGSEPVLIEGTVKGSIRLTGELRIGTKARIESKVHAKTVTVEGRVTGDVTADERVELVAGCTVDGNLKAPKIVVAEGARFRGNVDMGSAKPTLHADVNALKK